MSNWMWITQWGSRAVLGVLFLLSVWSIAIMIDRSRVFRRFKRAPDLEQAKTLIRNRDWKALREWAGQPNSVHAGVLRAAMDTPAKQTEPIERAVKSYLSETRLGLEKGLTVLATLGSNAPFIGLFGTVLGIIQAFAVLSTSQSGTSSIMSSIAEALIATAFGLFVAIPAVVAYNVFSRSLKTLLVECESLRDLYLSQSLIKES